MDEKIGCISCPRARFRIKAGAVDAISLVLGVNPYLLTLGMSEEKRNSKHC